MKGYWRIVVTLFVLSLVNHLYSQPTLYLFVVIQKDNRIGSMEDLQTIESIATEIESKVQGMTVKLIPINGKHATKEAIYNEFVNLTIGPDDVIWYYYSGHGINYNEWPQSDQGAVPLTWVNSLLRASNARLTITMYDCCNYSDPVRYYAKDNRYTTLRINYLPFLLLYSKGNIMASSSSSGEFSFGASEVGGIFTCSFRDAFKHKPTWEEVFSSTKEITITTAQAKGRVQHPKVLFSSGFIDADLTKFR